MYIYDYLQSLSQREAPFPHYKAIHWDTGERKKTDDLQFLLLIVEKKQTYKFRSYIWKYHCEI